MLFLLGTLRDDPRLFVLLVIAIAIALLVGLSFHEFAHAFVADLLGDSLPRRAGRLSLSPAAHLDAYGTFLVIIAGFGWGKPVPFNPRALRVGEGPGTVLVKFAGPLSNFLLAAAFAVPLKTGMVELRSQVLLDSWTFANYLAFLLYWIVVINTTLGVFNLLPIPPLDGGGVAILLPGEAGDIFRRMERERWGIGILILLIALPWFTNGQVDIIGAIIDPIRTRLLLWFLVGG